MKTINFKNKELVVWKTGYQDNEHLAIVLVRNSENITKESWSYLKEYTLSVNKDDDNTNENCFWLKNYSENKHIANYLVYKEYLKKTGKELKVNFPTHSIIFPEVEMTKKFKECIINFKK